MATSYLAAAVSSRAGRTSSSTASTFSSVSGSVSPWDDVPFVVTSAYWAESIEAAGADGPRPGAAGRGNPSRAAAADGRPWAGGESAAGHAFVQWAGSEEGRLAGVQTGGTWKGGGRDFYSFWGVRGPRGQTRDQGKTTRHPCSRLTTAGRPTRRCQRRRHRRATVMTAAERGGGLGARGGRGKEGHLTTTQHMSPTSRKKGCGTRLSPADGETTTNRPTSQMSTEATEREGARRVRLIDSWQK